MRQHLSGKLLAAVTLLAVLASGALAQTNFVWTNATSGTWSTSNKWGVAVPPLTGGSNDYAITFNTNVTLLVTNNIGSPNFLLNQLTINTGVVTIYSGSGTNLVFTNNTSGLLPQFTQNSASNATFNTGLTLGANTTFGGTGSGSVLLGGIVGGSGTLIKTGANILFLNAANTFTGGLLISNGTVRLGNASGLTVGNVTTITSGGAFDFAGQGVTNNRAYSFYITGTGVGGTGALVNYGGAINANASVSNLVLLGNATIGGTQRWDIGTGANGMWLNGGGYSLTKTGSNQITVRPQYITNLASIVIDQGQLKYEAFSRTDANTANMTNYVNSGAWISSYGALTLNMPLVFNGGYMTNENGTVTYTGNVILNSNLTVEPAAGTTNILSGAISGPYTVLKAGPGGLVLSGSNTFTGGIRITNSIVRLGRTNALIVGNVTTITSGGAFDFNGYGQTNRNYTFYIAGTGVGGGGALVNNGGAAVSQFASVSNLVLTANATIGGGQRWDVGAGVAEPGMWLNGGGFVLTKTGGNEITLRQQYFTNLASIIINQGAIKYEAYNRTDATTANMTNFVNTGAVLRSYGGLTLNVPIVFNGGTLDNENGSAVWTGNVTLNSNVNINARNTTTITLAGNVDGAGALNKIDVGLLVLSGTNSYTGGTYVNVGNLQFNITNSIPAAGLITINNAGLVVSGAYSTVTGWLNSASINTISTGALALVVNNSENINMGVYSNLSLGAAIGKTVTYTGTLTPGTNGYFVGGGLGTITFSGANAFTSSNRLTIGNGGGGVVIVTGNNDFSGGTLITAGTVLFGNNTASGSLGSGNITNNATIQYYRNDTYTISNNIYGTGTFRQLNGAGQVTLLGTNAITTLSIGSQNSAKPLIFGSGSSNTIGGVSIGNSDSGVGTYGKLVIQSNATVRVTGDLMVGNTASRSGAVEQVGGVLIVGNELRVAYYPTETSTYLMGGGTLTVNNGTLSVGWDGTGLFTQTNGTVLTRILVLDNNGAGPGVNTYNLQGGTLTVGAGGITTKGTTNYAMNLSGGTLSASTNWSSSLNLNFTNVNGNATVAPQINTTITLTGALSGTGGMNTAGNGIIILTGTNTYAGGTTVNGSLLRFNSTNAIAGTGRNVTVNTGGAVAFNYADIQNMLTTRVDSASAGTIALLDANSSDIIDFSAASLSNAFLGSAGDVWVIANFTPFSTTNYNFGGGGGTLTYQGYITGDTSINIGGGGPLSIVYLNQFNDNTGPVTILNNVLRATDGWGSSANANLIIKGGVFETDFEFTRALGTNANEVQVLNGGFSAFGLTPVTVNIGGNASTQTWGSTYFQPSVFVLNEITAEIDLTFTNSLDLNGADRTISVRATNPAAPAIIAGTILGTGGLIKEGVGNLILNVKPTYSGVTTINNGVLTLNAGVNTLPTTMSVSFSNNAGAVLNLNNNNQQLASISGAGGVVRLGTATLTVGDSGNTSFGGSINGMGGLVKVGSGTLLLSGSSRYSGATIISNGTLKLSPATVAGPVLPGLFEGRVAGSFEVNLPNPNTTAQLTTRYANIKDNGSAYPATGGAWVDNSTYIYSGYVYNYADTNVTWTFVKSFDDSMLLKVDGVTLINNTAYNAIITNNFTLTPGAHIFELRLGQGGGGVGPVPTSWWTSGSLGFGYDPQGRGTNVTGFYQAMADPGNGTLFTTALNILPASSSLMIASNAVLDLNGAGQLVGPLTGPVGALITNTAATPAWFSIGLPTGSNATYSGLIADSGAVSNAISLYISGNGIQNLTATNDYTGGTYLIGGTLRSLYGVGVPTVGNLVIGGGVFEPGIASLTNAPGKGGGQIQFAGGGGFSAHDVPLTVNIGGAGAMLVVGTNYFNPGVLVLNGVTANTNLVFVNPIDIKGSIFNVDVEASTAYLANGLTNSITGGALRKIGDGTLVVSNAGTLVLNSANGLYISHGNLALASGVIQTIANTPDYIGYLNNDYGTLTLQGNSALIRSNNNLIIGAYADSKGVLVLQDNAQYRTPGVTYVGDNGTGVVFMSGGTIYNPNVFLMGNNSYSVGAFYQSGGAVYVGGEFDIGYNQINAYGFYQLAGGSLTNNNWFQAARAGIGIAYMTGGTNIGLNSGAGIVVGNNTGGNGTGVLYIANGSYVNVAGQMGIGWSGGSTAEVTIDTNATVLINSATAVRFNQVAGSQNGILNLNGGVLQATKIYKDNTGASSVLNFNGGTYRASVSGTILGNNTDGLGGALDNVYIYGRGATFDTVSFVVTNNQDLLAPPGKGVTNINIAVNLPGYVGAPYVSITGDGAGATAIALFNATSGTVTGILVTSAGTGFSTAPNVVLVGGGCATTNLGAIAQIGNNTSGSLTKLGSGTLILNGMDTYTGGTVIEEGRLQFNAAITVPSTGLVNIRSNGIALFNFANIQSVLSNRVDSTSSGTIILRGFHQTEVIDLNSANLSNVYIGAIENVTLTDNFIPYNNNFHFGGGGGVLTYTNVMGPSASLDLGTRAGGLVLVLTATNSNVGTIVVTTGNTLRADDGIGLSTNANLVLAGGMLETGAGFTRDLGTNANQVQVFGGGFSAYGAPATINIGGLGATQTWGSTYFNTSELILNGIAANTNLTFVNSIDLNGGTRAISVNTTSAPATITGQILGTGNLAKNGIGRLILDNANTYSGSTIINGGTLQLSANDRLPTTTALILSNNPAGAALALNNYSQTVASLSGGGAVVLGSGTLTVGDGTTTTFGGVISGSGGVVKTGSGTLTFSIASHTYTGLTLVTQGTLGLDNARIVGAVTLTNGTTLAVSGVGVPGALGEFYNNTANQANLINLATFNASLSGLVPNLVTNSYNFGLNGNFDFGSTGTYFPSPYNTGTPVFQARFTGRFVATVSGVYVIGAASDDGSMIYIDGATIVTNNFGQGITERWGSVYLDAGMHDIVFAYNNTGSGYGYYVDVALPGGSTNRLPQSLLLYGNPEIGSLNGDANSLVALSNTTLGIVQSVDGTFYGRITGTNTDSIIKSGSAVLALLGTNTYGAGTIVRGGVLRASYGVGLPTTGNLMLTGGVLETMGSINNDLGSGDNQLRLTGGASGFSAYGAPLTVNIGGSGGTLVWSNANFNPSALVLNAASANDNLTFVNSIDLGGTNRTITVNSPTVPATITGQILGSGGLIKSGFGTLILGNTNSYTGGTFINNGTLQMGAANILPATTALTITNVAGATLNLSSYNQTIASLSGGGSVLLGSGTLTVGDASSTTYRGVISGDGGLIKTGSGSLTFTTNQTYTGLTLVTQGTVALQGAQLAGAVTLTNGSTLSVASLAGLMGEYYNITPVNVGNVNTNFATLAALNLHLSPYTPDYMALSSTTSTNFDFGRNTVTPPGAFTNTPYSSIGGRTTNFEVRWTGQFIAPTNGLYYFDTASDDGSMLWIDGNTVVNNNFFQGVTTRSGTVTLTAGAHDIAIGFYQGGGDYGVWADVALPGGSTNRIPNSLLYYGSQAQIGSLNGDAGSVVALNANSSLTIVQTTTGVFAGAITGVGNNVIVKEGSAMLSLLGTNTYNGSTTIKAGTLAINGRMENSSVTVNSGATLAGNGFIAGTVTINGGGMLSPGNSVGTLTVGNLTLTNGVKLVFELGPTNASDLVVVNNLLSLDGMDTNWFVLSAVSGFGEGTYTLFDATSITGSLGASTNFNNIAGYTGYLWLDDASKDVKLTVVPEPGAGTLVGAGLLAMYLLRRRRQG